MAPRKSTTTAKLSNTTFSTRFNVQNKMFELNDIVGNLFGIIKKFEYENEQLRKFCNLMTHFKHMLLYERQSFQNRTELTEFKQDLDDCMIMFRRFLSTDSEIFDFVKRKEISLYRKNEQYCRFDKENLMPDHNRASSLLFSELNIESNGKRTAAAAASGTPLPLSIASTSKQNFLQLNKVKSNTQQQQQQQMKQQVPQQSTKVSKSRLPKIAVSYKENNNSDGEEEQEEEDEENEDEEDSDADEQDKIVPATDLAIGTEQSSMNDRRFVNADTVLLNEIRFPIPNMSIFYRILKPKGAGTLFQCIIPKCGFSIPNSRGILGHLYRHFDLTPFKCSCCLYEHVTRKCLYRHASYHHKLDLYLFHHMDLFGTVARQNIANDNQVELKFRCKFPDCEFESFNTDSLANHLKWHLGDSPFKCPVCPARFSDRNQGYHHIRRGHRSYNRKFKEESLRRCPFYPDCRFLVEQSDRSKLDTMLGHIENDHNRTLKKVDGIGMKYEGQKNFLKSGSGSGGGGGGGKLSKLKPKRKPKQQLESMEDDEDMVGFRMSYSCTYDDCRFRCKSVTEMKAHELRKHRKKVYTCTHYQCDVVFDKLADKNRHIRETHIAQFVCDIEGCAQAFQTGQRLNHHMKESHTEVYKTCSICNKSFDKRKAMMRHIRLWHSVGEFKCSLEPDCQFVSSLRNEYDRHRKRAHPQTKPCPVEGCGKMVQVGRFNWHLRRHYNVRDKFCSWPECGKAFPDIPSLKNHLRIHLNFKRYRCTWAECGYASEQRTNVIKHIRIRHFKLPYTKREELELNLPRDPNGPKPSDYVSKLAEDVEI